MPRVKCKHCGHPRPDGVTTYKHCVKCNQQTGILKAGITVDDWKVPIFRELLDGNSFDYQVHNGLTKKDRIIVVWLQNSLDAQTLHYLTKSAQRKAAELKN